MKIAKLFIPKKCKKDASVTCFSKPKQKLLLTWGCYPSMLKASAHQRRQKICIALFCLLILPAFAFSQIGPDSSLSAFTGLDEINSQRLKINRTGMTILGSWAVANIGISGIQYFRTEGSTRSFHQMNVFWNVVNLGLAASGFFGSSPENANGLSLSESVAAQQSIEKILLFNGGLDVGYIMTGFFLKERSKTATRRQDLLKGYGNSLLVQGGFLLLFDIGLFLVHNNHASKGLFKFLETVQISPGGLSITF